MNRAAKTVNNYRKKLIHFKAFMFTSLNLQFFYYLLSQLLWREVFFPVSGINYIDEFSCC